MTPVALGDGICARCGKATLKGMLVCDACQIAADAFNAAIRLHRPTLAQRDELLAAAKLALEEMIHTVAPRNSFTDAIDALDAAITKAEGRKHYGAPEATHWIHGKTCEKKPHDNSSGGYLHGEDDDTPYVVDGWSYCGRCHRALEEQTS